MYCGCSVILAAKTLFKSKNIFTPTEKLLLQINPGVPFSAIRAAVEVYAKNHDTEDNSMGVYTPAEFEEAFNRGDFSKAQYWMKVY